MAQSTAYVEWVKTVGHLVLSWPVVGFVALALFYKPLRSLLNQFTEGDVTRLKVGEVEIQRELKKLVETVDEQQQKIEKQQQMLNKLVLFSLSEPMYTRLWQIQNSKEYLYRDEDIFRRHMFALLDRGLIQPKESGRLLFFDHKLDNQNLVNILQPTPIGEFLLELRGKPSGIQRPA